MWVALGCSRARYVCGVFGGGSLLLTVTFRRALRFTAPVSRLTVGFPCWSGKENRGPAPVSRLAASDRRDRPFSRSTRRTSGVGMVGLVRMSRRAGPRFLPPPRIRLPVRHSNPCRSTNLLQSSGAGRTRSDSTCAFDFHRYHRNGHILHSQHSFCKHPAPDSCVSGGEYD